MNLTHLLHSHDSGFRAEAYGARELSWRAFARSLVALVFAGSAACGGPASHGATGGSDAGGAGDGGSDAAVPIPAGPIAENLGPLAVAQAICQKVQQCACPSFAQSEPCQQDSVCEAATCVADFTRLYQSADTAAKATGRVYDPQGARACVDAVTAANCLDVDYTNLCTVMWNGTQAVGQPCGATLACETSDAAPAECGSDGGCVAISSTPAPGPPSGSPCSGTCMGSTCTLNPSASGGQCQHADGLACIGGTCKPLLSQGASCNLAEAFTCVDPLSCINGSCAQRLPNGSACTTGSADNPCVAGSGCLGACTTLKADGQTCTSDFECSSGRCSSMGVCIGTFASPICGN